jgi:ferredoxin-NADP reductase
VQLGVDLPGAKRLTRVFTISSSDSKPGERFTITMRANPAGQVSKFLTEQATIGTIVHLSQAQGEFILPDRVPEQVVFITGGSGITPAMSMLRSLQKRTHRGRITFLHYAQSPQHQIFADELADVATTGYGVDLHLLHPELGDPALTPMYLEKIIPNFREVQTWACGPAPLIEAVQAAYEGSDALQVEYFQPPKVSGKAGGEVAFARSGGSAENSGETLLVQAEAAGLTPAFGCRMGICFTCTARKGEGTVRNILTGETSSLPDENIRICVSAPEGDCSIDL